MTQTNLVEAQNDMMIAIYGCGGAGINVSATFLKHIDKTEPGFAAMVPYFIDTSDSNVKSIRSNIPEENLYLITADGIDGSGKDRKKNYDIIYAHRKDVLMHLKPKKLNIVIHSTSGGSGSVIGPVLVAELLKRGEPTIVIMIGGSASGIEADNTAKTLKGYERTANTLKVPVVAAYYENSKSSPRGQVDQRIHTTVVLLAAIFSGQNRELDSADLKNFLDYTTVTSFRPALTYLDFFSGDIALPKGQGLISVVTLTDDKTDSSTNLPVEYQAVGFVGSKAMDAVQVDLPVHTAIVTGYFNPVVKAMEKKVQDFEDAQAAFVTKSIDDDNDVATDDGLIL